MNPPSEPMISKHTYGPCGAAGCGSDRGRLYPGGRFCADHKPGQPATADRRTP